MYVIQSESNPSPKNKGGHVAGTQLLTPKGWKDISQITTADSVVQ